MITKLLVGGEAVSDLYGAVFVVCGLSANLMIHTFPVISGASHRVLRKPGRRVSVGVRGLEWRDNPVIIHGVEFLLLPSVFKGKVAIGRESERTEVVFFYLKIK